MMKRTVGTPEFPIWLLGDSAPSNWIDKLESPLDPRHPIRHNIWTSIENEIQEKIFRELCKRIDFSSQRLYIRNAVEHAENKPSASAREWAESVKQEVEGFSCLVEQYRPRLILTFGAFAFEFGRRAIYKNDSHNYRHYRYWNSKSLGDEFRSRTEPSNILRQRNMIPLLHRSIAGGYFIQGHEQFCGQPNANYFEFTGLHLAELIMQLFVETDDVWIT